MYFKMKKQCFIILIGLFLLSANTISAQKLISGDLSVLKGQKVVNITYDYSKMAVGKFATEAEYLQKGIDERNAKKPGSGDEWAAKWNAAKAEKCQPAFEEDFYKQVEDCGFDAKSDPGAKYTLVVRIAFVEQGVETVVMGTAKSASIDLMIDLIETSAPDKVLATIEVDGAKPKSTPKMSVGGVSVNKTAYDASLRIAECFESAGKQVGKLICKELK
jgi:hypothetical protein